MFHFYSTSVHLKSLPKIYSYYIYPSYKAFIKRKTFFYKEESYFQEECKVRGRKSPRRIWWEQFLNFIKHGSIDFFYFLYGFDVKNFRKRSDYVFESTFYRRREYIRDINPNAYQDMAVLRNKLLFSLFCSAYKIPSPRVYGTIQNGYLIELLTDSKTEIADFIVQNRINGFAKAIDGQCGEGVYSIEVTNNGVLVNEKPVGKDDLNGIFKKGCFILQERITNQHPHISQLHPHSINTIRLVTIKTKENNYVIIPPLLRVGTGHSNVDNWATGGLAIGIDTASNTLHEYGFRKPKYGGKVAEHPDTGIKFLGHPVPFMQEAINMAIETHKKLPNLVSIGWDIAITEDGPVFIEGNDNWEITLMEACSHGLNKEFKKYFY